MRRRNFIRNTGLGMPILLSDPFRSGREGYEGIPDYSYGRIGSLQEAMDGEGHVAIRIAFTGSGEQRSATHSGRVKVSGARITAMKEYFFESGEDTLDIHAKSWTLESGQENTDVIVLWLEDASPGTRVVLYNYNKMQHSFTLEELLDSQELTYPSNGGKVSVNFLSYRETGKIDPADTGIIDPGDRFVFTVMADPQGGDPYLYDTPGTRIKIHNAFLEETVERINQLEPSSLFTLVIGDIVDGQGENEYYTQMLKFLKRLRHPVLFEVGNHETKYRLDFGPGYNMEGFNNFFAAQKEMNGMEKMLYSFDLGRWHFIVWPDPLRDNFRETHPHYFDWLERDLEAHKDRPVMFFQHVPIHPVGIDPMTSYVESPAVKHLLFDILGRYGNVKFILSGHVHIPVKASFKTACSYKGMKMINLPAAGYRPRGFGEEDFFGGPAQGAAIIEIDGEQATVRFKTITEELFTYPDELPAFDPADYSLWLTNKWDLPAGASLVNGSFEDGLAGWARRYVYKEDADPSNFCEVRRNLDSGSFSALYLYSRRRGYDVPGQDRLPQSINQCCQAVSVIPGTVPVLELRYMIDGKNTDPDGFCGAYIWVEGFDGPYKKLNLVYSAGIIYYNLAGPYTQERFARPLQLALEERADRWHRLTANLKADHDRLTDGAGYQDLGLDRLVINLGTWTLNDGTDQPIGIWIGHVDLRFTGDEEMISMLDDVPVQQKPDDRIWWRGKDLPDINIGGEHRYHLGTLKRES